MNSISIETITMKQGINIRNFMGLAAVAALLMIQITPNLAKAQESTANPTQEKKDAEIKTICDAYGESCLDLAGDDPDLAADCATEVANCIKNKGKIYACPPPKVKKKSEPPKEKKPPKEEPKKPPQEEPKKANPKDPNLDISVYVDLDSLDLTDKAADRLGIKIADRLAKMKFRLRGADHLKIKLEMDAFEKSVKRMIETATWKTKIMLTVNGWGGPGIDSNRFTSELGIAGGHVGLIIRFHPFLYGKLGVGGAASFGGPSFVNHKPHPAFYGEAGFGSYLNDGKTRAFVEAQANLVNLAPGGGGGIGVEVATDKPHGFRAAIYGNYMGLVNPGHREGRDNPKAVYVFVPELVLSYVYRFGM